MAFSSRQPKTFVFFDTEGTGLPQPSNVPKFTELCFLAVSREELLRLRSTPRVLNKLTLCFNPQKSLNQSAVQVSGLTYDDLRECPTFQEQVPMVTHFLKHLPKPVCLIAHNGTRYDFPLLAKYLEDAGVDVRDLEDTVACVDSVSVFKAVWPMRTYRLDEMYRRLVGSSGGSDKHCAERDSEKLMEIVRKRNTEEFVDACRRMGRPLHFYSRPEEFRVLFSRN